MVMDGILFMKQHLDSTLDEIPVAIFRGTIARDQGGSPRCSNQSGIVSTIFSPDTGIFTLPLAVGIDSGS